MAQPNPEPSMEDILASIKRIIAEDSEAAAARAPRGRRGPVAVPDPEPEPEFVPEPAPEPLAAAPEPAPVSEIDEEPALPEPVAAAPSAPAEEPSDVLELTSALIEPEPVMSPAAAQPAQAPEAPAAESILSGPAALASRNAFAALTQLQVRSDEGKSNTLEGLVADLLRPMLREWLDRELPGVVERLVQDEIKRLSGR